MKRTLTGLLILFSAVSLLAQPANYGWISEFDGTYGNTRTFSDGASGSGFRSLTIQADSDNDEYVIEWDSFANKWQNGSTPLNAEFTLYQGGGGSPNGVITDGATNGQFYTFQIEGLDYSDRNAVVMETDATPIGFHATASTAVSTPTAATVNPGQDIIINIELAGAKSTQEKVFVRYSTDNFSTSDVVEATGTGSTWTTASATIPAATHTAAATINYYAYSTTVSATGSSNHDLISLSLANNGASNYSYSVNSTYISLASGDWSSTSVWGGTAIPISGASVTIDDAVTLNQDATLSGLTISSATFTASDGSARTLTITRSDEGSATTITNSGGTWANGAGGSTVFFSGTPNAGDAIHQTSGTIAFQNVTIAKDGGTSNVGVDFQTNSLVSGTLQIGAGGYVSAAPPSGFYDNAAILEFNQGGASTYNVGSSDDTWSTTEVPQNISITTGTLNLSGDRTATGNLVLAVGASLNVNEGIELEINGDFDQSGTFTLNASVSGYSQLKVDGTISGSGTATVEQYVASTGWHNMGLPIGTVNLSELGTVGTDVHANTQNMFWYNAASETWTNVSSGTESNAVGRGYSVYFGTSGVAASAVTVDVAGSLNTSVTPSLSFTGDGWNLIANPFACALDFDAVTLTNVNDSYSIWNAGSSSYTAVSPVSPSSTKIAPFQGFWVQANAGSPSLGTLTMATHGTVSASPSYLKTQTVIADRLFVQVYEAANPSKRDQVLFGMIPGTTDGLDSDWDAGKRINGTGVPSLMSKVQGVELAINAIDYSPNNTRAKKIPLRFVSTKAFEVYFIKIEDSLLTNSYTVILEDLLLNKRHNLNVGAYKFVHNLNAENRFVLHFKPMSTIGQGLTFQGQVQGGIGIGMNGGALVLKVKEMDQTTSMSVYDMSGKRVKSEKLASGSYEQILSMEGLPKGIYILELLGDQGYSSREKLYID